MSDASAPSPGLLLVMSGPSGVGKTTIAREIERRLHGQFSVSATTRPASPGDVEGRDYYFLSDEEFQRRVQAEEFLEWAEVFGRFKYGTPRGPVDELLSQGRLVILDIDVQGAQQIRARMPDALLIFIRPPSHDELERRLRARGRDSTEAVQRRLDEARREMEIAETCGAYDAHIVNDDLGRAIDHACELIAQRRLLTPS